MIVNIFNFISKFFLSGLKIIFILIFAIFLNRFLRFFVKKTVLKIIREKANGEKSKRVETIISVFSGTVRFIIWIVAFLIILSELGFNIGPILTSLGLVGFAFSFAAKDVIADFISGLFILLEDQYQIGNTVRIMNIEGKVKEITLRRTVIQDNQGFLHTFPNSQIKTFAKKEE